MAASLWCRVLFFGSVTHFTQAFVGTAAATCTRPVLPQSRLILLRPTVDSRKVVPKLQAIDGNDTPPSPPPEGSSPNAVKTFWREATKNFASKAVQQQQGEELLRITRKLDLLSGKLIGKLDLLLLLFAVSFVLQGFALGSRFPLTGQ